jgi:anti-anti-sigma factor
VAEGPAAPAGLQIVQHVEGRLAEVGLVGELDSFTRDRLDTVISALAGAGVQHLTVDMAGLTFMDSGGISTLLNARETVVAAGGGLTLANVPGIVRRIIEVTGLTALLLDDAPGHPQPA